jgi:hypothetical protein
MECERPQSDQAVLLWTGSRVDQQMIDFPDERTHLLRAETRFAVWIDAADQQGSYVRLRDQSIEVACRIKMRRPSDPVALGQLDPPSAVRQ